MPSVKISRRESGALMNSLTAGVVPRIGLRHIAVGRKNEVNAFLHDIATIEDGGASFRLVSGQYGSGKSFLLQMIRNNAMERNFVVADADLSPERRLTGTKGQGLATYRELMQHLSTLTRPESSALESILQKWINSLQTRITKARGFRPGDPEIVDAVSGEISEVLTDLSEMGFRCKKSGNFTKPVKNITNGIFMCHKQVQYFTNWSRKSSIPITISNI